MIALPLFLLSVAGIADEGIRYPTQGKPAMVDFGSKTCVPCKMMEPVLENVREKYKGKASVLFIDVKKDFRQKVVYNIRMIPTQVFFDKNGVELTRHVGFLDEEGISRILDGLISSR